MSWRTAGSQGAELEDGVERRLSKLELVVAVVQEQNLRIKSDTEEIITHVKETNGRLSQLETWQARVLGAGAVLVFAMGTFGVYAMMTW